MRIIKFRAWDVDGKCWIPEELIIIDSAGNLFTWCEHEKYFAKETIEHIICKYTGLLDKNGKEIYEGDLWQRDKTICQVVFKFCKWELEMVSGPTQYPAFYSNASGGEIIGNIYENPSLLESK